MVPAWPAIRALPKVMGRYVWLPTPFEGLSVDLQAGAIFVDARQRHLIEVPPCRLMIARAIQ
jgi:hypothetical protein